MSIPGFRGRGVALRGRRGIGEIRNVHPNFNRPRRENNGPPGEEWFDPTPSGSWKLINNVPLLPLPQHQQSGNYESHSYRGQPRFFQRARGKRSRGDGRSQDRNSPILRHRDLELARKQSEPYKVAPLGSEEERQQKIAETADKLKQKLSVLTGGDSVNFWEDDISAVTFSQAEETINVNRGIAELSHDPPELNLTVNDLRDIGRVDSEHPPNSGETCETIAVKNVAKDNCDSQQSANALKVNANVNVEGGNSLEVEHLKDTALHSQKSIGTHENLIVGNGDKIQSKIDSEDWDKPDVNRLNFIPNCNQKTSTAKSPHLEEGDSPDKNEIQICRFEPDRNKEPSRATVAIEFESRFSQEEKSFSQSTFVPTFGSNSGPRPRPDMSLDFHPGMRSSFHQNFTFASGPPIGVPFHPEATMEMSPNFRPDFQARFHSRPCSSDSFATPRFHRSHIGTSEFSGKTPQIEIRSENNMLRAMNQSNHNLQIKYDPRGPPPRFAMPFRQDHLHPPTIFNPNELPPKFRSFNRNGLQAPPDFHPRGPPPQFNNGEHRLHSPFVHNSPSHDAPLAMINASIRPEFPQIMQTGYPQFRPIHVENQPPTGCEAIVNGSFNPSMPPPNPVPCIAHKFPLSPVPPPPPPPSSSCSPSPREHQGLPQHLPISVETLCVQPPPPPSSTSSIIPRMKEQQVLANESENPIPNMNDELEDMQEALEFAKQLMNMTSVAQNASQPNIPVFPNQSQIPSTEPFHLEEQQRCQATGRNQVENREEHEHDIKTLKKMEDKNDRCERIDLEKSENLEQNQKLNTVGSQSLQLSRHGTHHKSGINDNIVQSGSITSEGNGSLQVSGPKPSTKSLLVSTIDANWKDKVINQFLKMSKKDICNMVNSSGLRKFDIAMKHLVKERKYSLSQERRCTADDKVKGYDMSREEFMNQLSAMLDPSATVDVNNLPAKFIQHLGEVLKLDIQTHLIDSVDSGTMVDDTIQDHLAPDMQLLNTAECSELPAIANHISIETMKGDKQEKTVFEEIFPAKITRAKLPHKSPTQKTGSVESGREHLSHRFISAKSKQSMMPEEGPDSNDIIFIKSTTSTVEGETLVEKSPLSVSVLSEKTCDRTKERRSKNCHDLSERRNSPNIECDARNRVPINNLSEQEVGRRSTTASSRDTSLSGKSQSPRDKDTSRSLGSSSHKKGYQTNRNHSPPLPPEGKNCSPIVVSSMKVQENSVDSESDSMSSSGTISSKSDRSPSRNVTKLLKIIKEKEKIAKHMSLNETIRDEVTAEIEYAQQKNKEKLQERKIREREKERKKQEWREDRKELQTKNLISEELSLSEQIIVDKIPTETLPVKTANHITSKHEGSSARMSNKDPGQTPVTETKLAKGNLMHTKLDQGSDAHESPSSKKCENKAVPTQRLDNNDETDSSSLPENTNKISGKKNATHAADRSSDIEVTKSRVKKIDIQAYKARTLQKNVVKQKEVITSENILGSVIHSSNNQLAPAKETRKEKDVEDLTDYDHGEQEPTPTVVEEINAGRNCESNNKHPMRQLHKEKSTSSEMNSEIQEKKTKLREEACKEVLAKDENRCTVDVQCKNHEATVRKGHRSRKDERCTVTQDKNKTHRKKSKHSSRRDSSLVIDKLQNDKKQQLGPSFHRKKSPVKSAHRNNNIDEIVDRKQRKDKNRCTDSKEKKKEKHEQPEKNDPKRNRSPLTPPVDKKIRLDETEIKDNVNREQQEPDVISNRSLVVETDLPVLPLKDCEIAQRTANLLPDIVVPKVSESKNSIISLNNAHSELAGKMIDHGETSCSHKNHHNNRIHKGGVETRDIENVDRLNERSADTKLENQSSHNEINRCDEIEEEPSLSQSKERSIHEDVKIVLDDLIAIAITQLESLIDRNEQKGNYAATATSLPTILELHLPNNKEYEFLNDGHPGNSSNHDIPNLNSPEIPASPLQGFSEESIKSSILGKCKLAQSVSNISEGYMSDKKLEKLDGIMLEMPAEGNVIPQNSEEGQSLLDDASSILYHKSEKPSRLATETPNNAESKAMSNCQESTETEKEEKQSVRNVEKSESFVRSVTPSGDTLSLGSTIDFDQNEFIVLSEISSDENFSQDEERKPVTVLEPETEKVDTLETTNCQQNEKKIRPKTPTPRHPADSELMEKRTSDVPLSCETITKDGKPETSNRKSKIKTRNSSPIPNIQTESVVDTSVKISTANNLGECQEKTIEERINFNKSAESVATPECNSVTSKTFTSNNDRGKSEQVVGVKSGSPRSVKSFLTKSTLSCDSVTTKSLHRTRHLHRINRKKNKKPKLDRKDITETINNKEIVTVIRKLHTKESVMARMIEIDVEIHKLMSEKMNLYQMLESGALLTEQNVAAGKEKSQPSSEKINISADPLFDDEPNESCTTKKYKFGSKSEIKSATTTLENDSIHQGNDARQTSIAKKEKTNRHSRPSTRQGKKLKTRSAEDKPMDRLKNSYKDERRRSKEISQGRSSHNSCKEENTQSNVRLEKNHRQDTVYSQKTRRTSRNGIKKNNRVADSKENSFCHIKKEVQSWKDSNETWAATVDSSANVTKCPEMQSQIHFTDNRQCLTSFSHKISVDSRKDSVLLEGMLQQEEIVVKNGSFAPSKKTKGEAPSLSRSPNILSTDEDEMPLSLLYVKKFNKKVEPFNSKNSLSNTSINPSEFTKIKSARLVEIPEDDVQTTNDVIINKTEKYRRSKKIKSEKKDHAMIPSNIEPKVIWSTETSQDSCEDQLKGVCTNPMDLGNSQISKDANISNENNKSEISNSKSKYELEQRLTDTLDNSTFFEHSPGKKQWNSESVPLDPEVNSCGKYSHESQKYPSKKRKPGYWPECRDHKPTDSTATTCLKKKFDKGYNIDSDHPFKRKRTISNSKMMDCSVRLVDCKYTYMRKYSHSDDHQSFADLYDSHESEEFPEFGNDDPQHHTQIANVVEEPTPSSAERSDHSMCKYATLSGDDDGNYLSTAYTISSNLEEEDLNYDNGNHEIMELHNMSVPQTLGEQECSTRETSEAEACKLTDELQANSLELQELSLLAESAVGIQEYESPTMSGLHSQASDICQNSSVGCVEISEHEEYAKPRLPDMPLSNLVDQNIDQIRNASEQLSEINSNVSEEESARQFIPQDSNDFESKNKLNVAKLKEIEEVTVPRIQYSVHKGPILEIKVFGNSILAASEDGVIYRYSQTCNGILNTYEGHQAAVTCMHVLEVSSLGTTKDLLFSGSLDGSLRCYDIKSGQQVRDATKVGSPVQCMDQSWGVIFLGTKSGCVSRYHVKSNTLKGEEIKFSDESVLALKSTTEGPRRVLIVASRSQPITIRDAQSGLFLRTVSGHKSHTVYSLMMESNLVFCGTSSTAIPVFDFINGSQVRLYNAGPGIVCMRMYKFLLFAGCYDGNIYVFDTKVHRLVCSIPGPGNMLLSMDIVKDKLIAGSKDRRLHMWQMPNQVQALLTNRA
ncbi:uncharacterized protein LOC105685438 isoform X1 [Athalia rosae]|uniref:uncharacterized protein LOC105685438 isoform X1 n=1 Tax=Athalia rosae TaxID=37344 RepID=UPI0020336123|nr:uncharacterized protein LOC105685438 isoform X1 [Athalia rosae]